MSLWPNGAPGALGQAPHDIPTLTPFLAPADNNSGSAIVICPGGGYGGLASHEGATYAQFLQKHGINGFVLKSIGLVPPVIGIRSCWAMPPEPFAPSATMPRNGKLTRKKSGSWVRLLGHLASTAITHFDKGDPKARDPIDRVSSRPNAGILCYPVITMGKYTHQGSKRNLLGNNPPEELVNLLSSENRFAKTPHPLLFGIQQRIALCRWRTVFFSPPHCARPACHSRCMFTKKAGTGSASQTSRRSRTFTRGRTTSFSGSKSRVSSPSNQRLAKRFALLYAARP